MAQKTKILLAHAFSPELISRVQAVSLDLVIVEHEVRQSEGYAGLMANVEVLYTAGGLPSPEIAPHLKWVQGHWAGIDMILDHPLYTSTDVMFTSANGIHPIATAEYVLAQMLALSHRLPFMLEDQQSSTWPEKRWVRYLPDELYGATLGIVGYGSIGRQVARLAQAFGMHILAMKRDIHTLTDPRFSLPGIGDPEGKIPEHLYPPEALHEFLALCDYVVLIAPLNSVTHHLIDAAALNAMKPTAYLINVARGDVVDEQALIQAMSDKKIAGAALDVYSQEPLPVESPLWHLPNVILSPHIAGFTPHYEDRAISIFTENLQRYLAGKPLINLVDRSRDY
jgi:phosphoglycerate dehydrogenase-like enzyme